MLLDRLLEDCSHIDMEFLKIDPGKLTFYAVEVRYPDDFIFPTDEDTRKAFDNTSLIRKIVLQKLNVDKSELKIPKP